MKIREKNTELIAVAQTVLPHNSDKKGVGARPAVVSTLFIRTRCLLFLTFPCVYIGKRETERSMVPMHVPKNTHRDNG